MTHDVLRQLEETLRKKIDFDQAQLLKNKAYAEEIGVEYITNMATLYAMIRYLLRDEARK
jgi:NADH dehydrogenase/NADH:ubiquinone oxidoreductase subunit G